MAATDTDDDIDTLLGIEPDEDDVPEPRTTFICDYIDPDTKEVCGADFDSKAKLNGHVTGKHRDRSGDKKPSKAKSEKPDKASRDAGKKVAVVPVDRVATYTQSIAMIGLGAHIGVPAFDEFDLNVVTQGAPSLAAALAAVGEKHTSVQQACDLVLGGGTGGAYVQLVLASMAMFAPIAAHHGWLPPSVGERFGAVIGVAAAPPVTGSSPPPPAQDGDGPVTLHTPDPTNPDDVLAFMAGIPESVMFDVAGKMMGSGGAIGVSVPGTFDIPEERSPNGVGPAEAVSAAESPDSAESSLG